METEMKKGLPTKETVLEQLNWRYATKQFDSSKKISDGDWAALQKAMMLAPSSYGLQPYKFAVVTDEEMKEKLKPACYGQPQITESSHLVIFMAKKVLDDAFVDRYAERVKEVRGEQREGFDDYVQQMKDKMSQLMESGNAVCWSQRQSYLALGFLLESAAMLGIDACPMEGFQPDKVDEILKIEGYTASALCTLGYRSEDDWLADLEKVRFSEETLIEKFG